VSEKCVLQKGINMPLEAAKNPQKKNTVIMATKGELVDLLIS
jgi:hypothetical protein